MPSSEPSKYSENQIESATRKSYALMSEFIADMQPRAMAAAGANPLFTTVLGFMNTAATAWNSGETTIANAEASLPGLTYAFEDKIASVTRKPDADTGSVLEGWDLTLRGQATVGSPLYMQMLPNGRDTLTAGTYEQQLDALRDFGVRLTAQVAKPVLVTLGGTVTTFANAARALRTAQTSAKAAITTARELQEPRRFALAAACYSVIGQGMVGWSMTSALVDTLWDVNILRNPALAVPAAPADTTWAPEIRTLSTTAMPAGGTRLEAWREGPGGMPELLITGAPGELNVLIPATITFTPGGLYQLWLVALNSRGHSDPGPVQNWTAV